MSKKHPPVKIVSDPKVCHGKPIFEDTRIMVWQVLELLESGESQEKIHTAYPSLPQGAIESALHYAAERAKKERHVTFRPAYKSRPRVSA